MNVFDTPAGPTDRPRQLDIKTKSIGRGFQTFSLLNLNHDRFDLMQ